MSAGQYSSLVKQATRPVTAIIRESNDSREAARLVPDESSKRVALWSDRVALRIWLVSCLVLWLLGLINLLTGIARR